MYEWTYGGNNSLMVYSHVTIRLTKLRSFRQEHLGLLCVKSTKSTRFVKRQSRPCTSVKLLVLVDLSYVLRRSFAW